MTYREVLLEAARTFEESDTPFLDALLLLAASLGATKEQVLARLPEQAAVIPQQFHEYVQRRRQGESIAHILGYREFYGHLFLVNDDVLTPRPDTETLVEAALEVGDALAGSRPDKRIRVLDLCTGSGAVAISLAGERPLWSVSGADISLAALDVARYNARKALEREITLLQSDLFSAIDGKFHLITANPPYVPTDQARSLKLKGWKDPLIALDGGDDGMDLIRRIVAEAPAFLEEGGALVMEMDPAQIPCAGELLAEAGFREIKVWKDLGGHARVTGGIHD